MQKWKANSYVSPQWAVISADCDNTACRAGFHDVKLLGKIWLLHCLKRTTLVEAAALFMNQEWKTQRTYQSLCSRWFLHIPHTDHEICLSWLTCPASLNTSKHHHYSISIWSNRFSQKTEFRWNPQGDSVTRCSQSTDGSPVGAERFGRSHRNWSVGRLCSVSVAALGQDAAGLRELGGGYVEQGGTWHEGQQRQVLLQLVQSGDGDDAIRVEQPVAEQDNQTLLLGNQVLKGL